MIKVRQRKLFAGLRFDVNALNYTVGSLKNKYKASSNYSVKGNKTGTVCIT